MTNRTLYESIHTLSPRDLARMALEAEWRATAAYVYSASYSYTYNHYLRDREAAETFVAAARAQLGRGRDGAEETSDA